MALVRWNPWSDLFTLHNHMDQVLQSVSPDTEQRGADHLGLPVDIRQSDQAFAIEASVPGFAPEDVEVTVDDGVLTIAATHREDRSRDDGGYIRRERRVGSLFRQIGLPADVRSDDITADFHNGVLTVTVPRAQRSQPKRIQVSAGASRHGAVLEGTTAGEPS